MVKQQLAVEPTDQQAFGYDRYGIDL